ncbi:hypothetical protein NQ317_016724 [Molorchus minor]|uniref:Dynein heavy chain tail domain-containing protein n=1 Tax=Molorchus minor TaxID=1323400 RepID=A0ABQ9IY81_9CUCU|nr:hypothetical protein NQ317_016724 [Molorchus minor]
MDQQNTQIPDYRIEFLRTFVQKTLKLKQEKWTRMMSTEENKSIVMKFLERSFPVMLVIVLTPAAQLIASDAFPVKQLKAKGVFFYKKNLVPASKTSPSDSIIAGDLSPKIIGQLATLVDEILVPLLSNSVNHIKWPIIIAKDVAKHVHSLKSTMYQVKGQVNGQTVLPMPVGVENIFEVEKALINSNGEMCDLYLRSAIEGVIIKWSGQINDVLINDSSEKKNNASSPCSLCSFPPFELEFWSTRQKNLQYIYKQLREDKVKSMAIVLQKTNSAYYSCFKNTFKNVVIALAETENINTYLTPLKKHIQLLEETDFSECIPLLAPLVHVIYLIWLNCKSFDQGKLTTLLKQISNLLILEVTFNKVGSHDFVAHYSTPHVDSSRVLMEKKFLDPTTLFHSDLDEALQRVHFCIKLFRHFLYVFNVYKRNLPRIFRDRQPTPWNFDLRIVFHRGNAFLERLETIQWFFNTVKEFNKLEKVVIGGIKGRILSARINEVFNEFQQCFTLFSGKSYDVLDPNEMSFLVDFESFKLKIAEMDMKLAAILCQSFKDCPNLESTFKLINIAGSIIERPLIKKEFSNQYENIIDMLECELRVCDVSNKELFMEQVKQMEKTGQFNVNKYMPPVAGTLQWCHNLSLRISGPLQNIRALLHHSECKIDNSAKIRDPSEMEVMTHAVSTRWHNITPARDAGILRGILHGVKNVGIDCDGTDGYSGVACCLRISTGSACKVETNKNE